MIANYNFLTCDTETGGLSADKHPIAEIAFCAFNNVTLEDVGEYESLIKPYDNTKVYQQQALDANGLTMEDIKGGKDSKVVIEEIIQFMKKLKCGNNKPIFVGHNFEKFDINFMVEFFAFHKKNILDYVDERIEDTMWWSRYRRPESANYKLGTCVSNEGIELVNAHRALSDTRATKELFKGYIRNLRSTSNGNVEEKRFRHTFEF